MQHFLSLNMLSIGIYVEKNNVQKLGLFIIKTCLNNEMHSIIIIT